MFNKILNNRITFLKIGFFLLLLSGCSSNIIIPFFPDSISASLKGESTIIRLVDFNLPDSAPQIPSAPNTNKNSEVIDVQTLINAYGPTTVNSIEENRLIPLSSFSSISNSLNPLIAINYITSIELDEASFSGSSVSSTKSMLYTFGAEYQPTSKRYKISYNEQQVTKNIYLPIEVSESFRLQVIKNPDDFYGTNYRGAFSYAFPYGITGIIAKFDTVKDRVFTIGVKNPIITDAIARKKYSYIGASNIIADSGPDKFVLGHASNSEFLKDGVQAFFAISLSLSVNKPIGTGPLSLENGQLKVWFPAYAQALNIYRAPNIILNPDIDISLSTIISSSSAGYEFKTTFASSSGKIKGIIRANFYGSYLQGIGGSFFIIDTTNSPNQFYWGGLGMARLDGFLK